MSAASSMLLALAALATAPGGEGPSYNGRARQLDVAPPRLEATVQVDGQLDEAAWARAARLTGFSRYAPVDDQPAPDSTEVLVWYSPTAIHFGVRAYAEPGTVRASLGDRDKSYTDDYIGIFLATQGDRRQAVVFAVNPLGVQGDGIVVEGTKTSGGGFEGAQIGREPTDVSPDFVFQSKGRLTDFGYEVEVRIPFKSLQFAAADTQAWAVNVIRKVQSRGEEHSWAPARRAAASYIAQFGRLEGLTALQRGRVLDVTPIATMRMEGAAPADDPDGWRYETAPRLGANVRYGLTSSLTLSATIRPDFAEVESDAGQAVTDPRQTLYFPEKRPFFLEGAEQFVAPANLIYTRRIADPRAAAKITGTVRGTQTALLVARESPETSLGADGHPLFTWLRTTRQLGASRLGFLYTGREDEGASNRVAGADARLVFGKVYSLQALAALSQTRLAGETRAAPMFQVVAARSGHYLAARYLFTSIADDFQTASGYIARDSIARVNVDHGWTTYGGEGALVQTASVDVVGDLTWRYGRFVSGGDAIEKKLHFNTNYGLKGGWKLGASVLVETFGFDPDYYGRFAVERHDAAGAVTDTVPFTGTPRLPNHDYLFSASTPNFRHLSANAFYIWGYDENFYEWSSAQIQWLKLGLDWRPTTQLRVSQSFAMQTYRRRSDGSLVGASYIPRLKVEYQLSRALLVRAVGEYQAEQVDSLRDDSRTNDPLLLRTRSGSYRRLTGGRSNDFRPELLVAYTPVPGTVFYAGYGATLADPDAWRFRRMERSRDGVFVKASYLFRL